MLRKISFTIEPRQSFQGFKRKLVAALSDATKVYGKREILFLTRVIFFPRHRENNQSVVFGNKFAEIYYGEDRVVYFGASEQTIATTGIRTFRLILQTTRDIRISAFYTENTDCKTLTEQSEVRGELKACVCLPDDITHRLQ